MKITVEHDVPYDRNLETTCQYAGDFWGNPVCRYHTHRDRTHGKKAPTERHVPKCALFDVWLPGEYQKCDECLAAITKKTGTKNPAAKPDKPVSKGEHAFI